MPIVLIIFGILGWIVDLNRWFIIPEIVYKGLIIGGVVWLVIALLCHILITNEISKKF